MLWMRLWSKRVHRYRSGRTVGGGQMGGTDGRVVGGRVGLVGAMSIAVRAERMDFAEFQEAFLPALRKAASSLGARLYPE